MAVTEGQLISDGTAVWKVKKIGSEVPAGTMQMFAGNTIPEGWLLCDGSAISRTDYAKLFSAIGTTWGAGDGSTTFNLPNSIGRFAEGAATSGSYKSAGLPNICGQVTLSMTNYSYPIPVWETSKYAGKSAIAPYSENSTFGLNTSSGTATSNTGLELNAGRYNRIYGASPTVQPPAFTIRYIIKY